MERWKEIRGFEGRYEVSDRGQVRSMNRTSKGRYGPTRFKGKLLAKVLDARGYVQVHLGRGVQAKAHRLVAEAFIGPAPTEQHHINHKNFDPADNRVENLEWMTDAANINHAVEGGRYAKKLTVNDVHTIRVRHAEGELFCEIAKDFGVSYQTVACIAHRQTWAHI